MTKQPDSTSVYLPNKAMNELTRLARATRPLCDNHPGECGILALDNSLDAFAARYRLAEMAERTLDVQYYIWEDDMSGRLLFAVLLAAAKRGVHVRLLLDDNNTPGWMTLCNCSMPIPTLKFACLILSLFACYGCWVI